MPPGRSTRAISGIARRGSTQCQAWAITAASTQASGSGMRSADPACTATPGTAATSCSRMGADGSTATTSRPAATSCSVNLPVPAPRSRTVRAGSGAAQATACGGYGGRPRRYACAAAPNEAACRARVWSLIVVRRGSTGATYVAPVKIIKGGRRPRT
ncbi:hypothetical protein Ate01nite_38780 [Actinoplanes teichomyceticus]|nr:hypothetical protein Ate01nite_38780 [Actinoplanes teichomyceticus]